MARILIIDDDPAMVSVISDICQERGHQTVAYASGQKALENLATHAPQLVISDLRMDKVGGLDILRETKEILGVHIIGEGASELLHIGQAVMIFGGTVEYFVNTVFNYPTLAECYKAAAFNGLNKLARFN